MLKPRQIYIRVMWKFKMISYLAAMVKEVGSIILRVLDKHLVVA